MDQVSLVKADVRKNQWTEIIQACQSSGMTVKAWCAENGIREYPKFCVNSKMVVYAPHIS